ncbi:angiopoietin-related protein 2-like [Hyalella azteca]|uniref:Angiopoietin-related protein 2-like n=1 Tax=Hyalella azteca TaxID=294128 RepID=A0A8B7PJC8_HYAAZ|nr:angiopoietin-related protein 2-like [Hyalella azteca]
MASSSGLRSSHTAIWLIIAAFGAIVAAEEIRVAELIASKAPAEPLALTSARRSSKDTAAGNSEFIQNDKKKSSSDNEVFDGSTKGQLNLVLAELREVRSEIREARQEHGRLASGISEISGQVRTISERKDQIKKKIRKLTKSLSKKDHHRKVKSGLRALQQDHERILQAMSKAKILNRVSPRRNNRTNQANPDGTHAGKRSRMETNEVGLGEESDNVSEEEVVKPQKEHKNKKRGRGNHNHQEEIEEVTRESLPVVLSFEIERKSTTTTEPIEITTPELRSLVEDAITPIPSQAPSTTTTTTTTPGTTSATSTTSTSTTTSPPTMAATTTTTSITVPPESTEEPLPTNCYEVLQHGNWTSGIYTIQPNNMKPIQVWCDQRTDGGGWTIIVARKPQDKQEDFARKWQDYKNGFGDPSMEHWIGLEAMHQMTEAKKHELRVNITDWEDEEFQAQWKEFAVGSEERSYVLTIGRYASSSTAGDALKWHNSMKFSTVDNDNDALMGGHCARNNQGGWWYRGYRGCYQAHPTGLYQRLDQPSLTTTEASKTRSPELGPYLYWVNWRNSDLFPKTMFLMIRPSLN